MSGLKVLTALPVYNEVRHLNHVLTEVKKHCRDILVVNDGSVDGTTEFLTSQEDLHVIHHETNLGYGAGLRSAFEYAQAHQYEALVTIDCDGQHQPCLIPPLAAALEVPDPVDIVSGSRYLQSFTGDSTPPASRKAINMRVNRLLKEELGLSLTDSFCGFKAYRVSALSDLSVTELGYAMPMQFWVQVVSEGLRVREFPVPLIYLEEERSFGGSLDDSDKRIEYYLSVFQKERSLRVEQLAKGSVQQYSPVQTSNQSS